MELLSPSPVPNSASAFRVPQTLRMESVQVCKKQTKYPFLIRGKA